MPFSAGVKTVSLIAPAGATPIVSGLGAMSVPRDLAVGRHAAVAGNLDVAGTFAATGLVIVGNAGFDLKFQTQRTGGSTLGWYHDTSSTYLYNSTASLDLLNIKIDGSGITAGGAIVVNNAGGDLKLELRRTGGAAMRLYYDGTDCYWYNQTGGVPVLMMKARRYCRAFGARQRCDSWYGAFPLGGHSPGHGPDGHVRR